MAAATCWNCDYPLDGLTPGPSRLIVCPECSMEQQAERMPARRRGGYLIGLLVSVAVQAACLIALHILGALHTSGSSPRDQFAGALAVCSPIIGTFAGVAAILLAGRGRKAGAQRGPWRLAGLVIVTLTVNGLIWLVVMAIALLSTTNGIVGY